MILDNLKSIMNDMLAFFEYYFTHMTIADYFDIAIVALCFYLAYVFIRDKRAGKLAAGVLVLMLIRTISEQFGLVTTHFIMRNIFDVGIIALVIIFQPELRSALEAVGSEPLKGLKMIGEQRGNQTLSKAIDEICTACCNMSKEKTGALIVIERDTKLGEYIKSGTIVDAETSSYLLENIFFKNAPLHDGAVIIRQGRIHAAGCYLPAASADRVNKDLGTRHRAAVGMSEVSDSIVIVVSEQTGTISVAYNGHLKRQYDYALLNRALTSILIEHDMNNKNNKMKKKEKKNRKSKDVEAEGDD
ncbi:MAG: TIGR00159 family protein [Ruminococcaceae bacterium]|nr:TIGR00159 family protein [Oscillospiraceae bacterium]